MQLPLILLNYYWYFTLKMTQNACMHGYNYMQGEYDRYLLSLALSLSLSLSEQACISLDTCRWIFQYQVKGNGTLNVTFL